jgi:hypothetical protein
MMQDRGGTYTGEREFVPQLLFEFSFFRGSIRRLEEWKVGLDRGRLTMDGAESLEATRNECEVCYGVLISVHG